MKRREFIIGSTVLTSLTAARPLLAHDGSIPDYALPEEQMPQMVGIKPGFEPFEAHVDPSQFALYWTLPENRALRYTVGIGRTGLYEGGEFFVGARKEWPSWTPTPDMIKRQPDQYAQFSDGMPGGINNPLGSRALYLFQSGRGDTFLRIHGTNDPLTIARRVSNGCTRLVNDQMIDLYNRVPMQSRVVLYPIV